METLHRLQNRRTLCQQTIVDLSLKTSKETNNVERMQASRSMQRDNRENLRFPQMHKFVRRVLEQGDCRKWRTFTDGLKKNIGMQTVRMEQ